MTGEEIWEFRKARWLKEQPDAVRDELRIDAIVESLRHSGVLNAPVGSTSPLPFPVPKWH